MSGDHCIDREIDESQSALATQDNVDECYKLDHFSDAWPCLENSPHIAGHGGMGRQVGFSNCLGSTIPPY